jgi:hypothetical protein
MEMLKLLMFQDPIPPAYRTASFQQSLAVKAGLILPAVHPVKHEGIHLASEFKVVLCHNDKYLPICRSGKGLV